MSMSRTFIHCFRRDSRNPAFVFFCIVCTLSMFNKHIRRKLLCELMYFSLQATFRIR